MRSEYCTYIAEESDSRESLKKFKSSRNIIHIVAHCTGGSQEQTVESIKKYWVNKGWRSPGYHFIVEPDGKVHQLSDVNKMTNGVRRYNKTSIHFCYIGGVNKNLKPIDNRTPEQKNAMKILARKLKLANPKAKVVGHRDLSPDLNGDGKIQPHERIKACPCFNAIPEYANV